MKKFCRGVFITGTDTGVGKTYIGAGLAAALRGRGMNVGVMKPAETGCPRRNGSLIPRDAHLLMKAAGATDLLDDVNPYRFAKPLAPSVAAREEGRKVSSARLMKAFDRLCSKHHWMIVEGAGGIMVPLSGQYSFLDLAADLRLPVLIVARPGLGTINHTLLTVNAIRNRGLSIAGIVINQAQKRKPGLAERTNPGVIKKLSGIAVIGIVGHGSRFPGRIADRISSLLDI